MTALPLACVMNLLAQLAPTGPSRPADPAPTTPTEQLSNATPSVAPRAPESRRGWFAAESGGFLATRTLAYDGGSPALLRGYRGSFAGPYLDLEVFPLSADPDHVLLAGIGLFGTFAVAAGLRSVAGSEHYATTFFALDVGAEWRLEPIGSSGFALVTALSYRSRRFALSPPFPGLPNADLSGIAGSLHAEVPLGDILTVLAGGGYTQWLRARDLIGCGFFPSGTAYAIGADAGLELLTSGPLSVRVVGFLESTEYSFDEGPTPEYRAAGAHDTQVGSRAVVRVRF